MRRGGGEEAKAKDLGEKVIVMNMTIVSPHSRTVQIARVQVVGGRPWAWPFVDGSASQFLCGLVQRPI